MINRIVVGEDDIEDQQILESYFQDHGLLNAVTFHVNGQKIIEYLDALESEYELPSLIVLDLNMPILNGTQTLYTLKQHPRYANIPVIIYSTSNNENEKRKCLNFGAADYLVKPVSFAEGERMVKRFMEFIPA